MVEIKLIYAPQSFYSQKVRLYLTEKGVKFTEQVVLLEGRGTRETLEPSYMKMNASGEVPVLQHGEKFISDSEKIMFYCEANLKGAVLLPDKDKEDILKFHTLLHELPVELLTYGSVVFPHLVENSRIPSLVRTKMRGNVFDANVEQRIQDSMARAPSDLKVHYQRRLENYKLRNAELSDEETVKSGIKTIEDALDIVEAHLKDKQIGQSASKTIYLCGSSLTIADIDLSVLLARLRFIGLENRLFPKSVNSSGDGEAIRPTIRRYLEYFDQCPSFQEIILKSYSMTHILKVFLNSKLKGGSTWLLGAGIVIIGGIVIYQLTRNR